MYCTSALYTLSYTLSTNHKSRLCSPKTWALDDCLKKQKKYKSKLNLEKARASQSNLRAKREVGCRRCRLDSSFEKHHPVFIIKIWIVKRM